MFKFFKKKQDEQPDPEENKEQAPGEDPWSNERFQAERNYDQEFTRTRYVRIKPKFPVFIVTVLTIIICIVLGVDIYNTATANDRTVINTIKENFAELSEMIKD